MGEIVGATFASIGTVFKLVDFCVQLRDVPLENKNFCELIRIVRNDLQECTRLLQIERVKQQLELNEARNAHVQQTIFSVRQALNDIGEYVESVSRDEERKKGHTKLVHRFQWVLGHQAKLESREKRLSTAHNSLLYVMSTLHTLENQSTTLPSYDEAVRSEDDDIIMSPDARWRRRRSEKKNDVDLIDLREQPDEFSEHDNQRESFDSFKPAPDLNTLNSLIDAPIQLGSSITSVSDIFNPPATVLNPVTQVSSIELSKEIPGQSPTTSFWSSQTTLSELSASSPNTSTFKKVELTNELEVPIHRESSARSAAEEERRRRRARQQLFFGE